MSKILFVDDEITRNLPVLEQLFGGVISADERDKLTRLRRNPLGATIDQIKQVLANNRVLEVEDSFAGAIERIRSAGSGRDYDLFLLDRNLATGNGMYKLAEIAAVMPGYDENALERYKGREGDFLLLLLHLQGVPCREKVYFYSAYQADDIRSALYLQHMIGFKTFSRDNFVDKSDSKAKDEFRTKVVEHLDRAMIAARYREAFSGLDKAKMGKCRDRLINVLRNNSIPNGDPRVLLEHLLRFLYENDYTSQKPQTSLDFRALRYKNDGTQRVPQFVFDHCLSIKQYCNHYASHTSFDAPGLPAPTAYSWVAVKCMLVDIFVWLDKEL